MRYVLISAICLFCSSGVNADQILENFQNFTPGKTNFSGWYINDRRGKADDVYTILKEGDNIFLHADSAGNNVQLFRKKRWSVKHNPYLTWKWRVIEHPVGAKPNTHPNDVAASVYVVFKKSLFSVRTIKYAWGVEGELGHVRATNPDYPQILIRNSPADKDKWFTETVNIFEDYKRLFGKDPGTAIAVGVLTEADQVKSRTAIADYDEFTALSQYTPPPKAKEPVISEEQPSKVQAQKPEEAKESKEDQGKASPTKPESKQDVDASISKPPTQAL